MDQRVTGELRLLRGSAADLPSLQPFWVAVHHQHIESMPHLAPYVADTTTWAYRAIRYRELLNKTRTILLLAEVAGRRVGYGLAHIHKSGDTWVADTWVTGPTIGEIESVSVLPDYRNQGIGTHLLDRLEQELADAGATDLILGTLPGNAAAIRMYERRGFQSTWLYMSRFAGRPESRNR
jgi:ribosomal protein S18 acetylase RimI-like enzyme